MLLVLVSHELATVDPTALGQSSYYCYTGSNSLAFAASGQQREQKMTILKSQTYMA